jgi:hypothetical protein
MRRRAFRATPRAAFVVTAIRLQSLTHLRACGAARFCLPPGDRRKAHPRRAMLGAPSREPNRLAPDRPRAPPRWAGRGKHAIACCGRLCECVPSSTLAVLSSRHEGWFTDTPPGIVMELPRHGSRPAPQGVAGAFSVVVGRLTWTASGHEPEKPSCGNAEPTMSPFGCGSAQGVLVLL